MISGFVLATSIYLVWPHLAGTLKAFMPAAHRILLNKYYWDEFYQTVFVKRTLQLGKTLWELADAKFIDEILVNGSARVVDTLASKIRLWQSGYLFQYAFAMIIGLIGILAVWVVI